LADYYRHHHILPFVGYNGFVETVVVLIKDNQDMAATW